MVVFLALNSRWRMALVTVSSLLLLFPVAIGFIQILCNKSGGFSYSLLGDSSIQDYYKIAEVKAEIIDNTKTGDQTETSDKL